MDHPATGRADPPPAFPVVVAASNALITGRPFFPRHRSRHPDGNGNGNGDGDDQRRRVTFTAYPRYDSYVR